MNDETLMLSPTQTPNPQRFDINNSVDDENEGMEMLFLTRF